MCRPRRRGVGGTDMPLSCTPTVGAARSTPIGPSSATPRCVCCGASVTGDVPHGTTTTTITRGTARAHNHGGVGDGRGHVVDHSGTGQLDIGHEGGVAAEQVNVFGARR